MRNYCDFIIEIWLNSRWKSCIASITWL